MLGGVSGCYTCLQVAYILQAIHLILVYGLGPLPNIEKMMPRAGWLVLVCFDGGANQLLLTVMQQPTLSGKSVEVC